MFSKINSISLRLARKTFISNYSTYILGYTRTHEWFEQVENNIIKVGLTRHAVSMLGEIVYVNCEYSIGEKFDEDEELLTLESVKAVDYIKFPYPGVLVDYNHFIDDDKSLINENPEDNGWLIKVKVSDLTIKSLKNSNIMLCRDNYFSFCKED